MKRSFEIIFDDNFIKYLDNYNIEFTDECFDPEDAEYFFFHNKFDIFVQIYLLFGHIFKDERSFFNLLILIYLNEGLVSFEDRKPLTKEKKESIRKEFSKEYIGKENQRKKDIKPIEFNRKIIENKVTVDDSFEKYKKLYSKENKIEFAEFDEKEGINLTNIIRFILVLHNYEVISLNNNVKTKKFRLREYDILPFFELDGNIDFVFNELYKKYDNYYYYKGNLVAKNIEFIKSTYEFCLNSKNPFHLNLAKLIEYLDNNFEIGYNFTKRFSFLNIDLSVFDKKY